MITTVAPGTDSGFSGDGGPATKAAFTFNTDWEPAGIAPLSDGGFLIADAGNGRVRRIGADGIVRTVAGGGKQTPGTRPIKATRVRLGLPLALLAEAGSGFLVGDVNDQGAPVVFRVDTRGRIRVVVGDNQSDRASLSGRGSGIFNGDGRHPAAAALTPVSLARALDGTLFIADRASGRVRAVLTPRRGLPSIAITRTAVGARSIRAEYVITRPGRVTASIARSKASVTATRSKGAITVTRPPHGGVHELELSLWRNQRIAASDTAGLVLGTLTPRIAARAINAWDGAMSLAAGELERCRRFGADRVDCERVWYDEDGSSSCYNVNAVTVGSDGLVRFREYDCPDEGDTVFRRFPKWSPALSSATWPPFSTPGVIPGLLL